MPFSMTGFARMQTQATWGSLVCEIKSVNHRYLDCFFRLPEALKASESIFREQIKKQVGRGKVECSFTLQLESDAPDALNYDPNRIASLIRAAESVNDQLRNPAPISALSLLSMPGVWLTQGPEADILNDAAQTLLRDTLLKHGDTRRNEGDKMAELIAQRAHGMQTMVTRLKSLVPDIRDALAARLREKITSLAEQCEEDRIEQEIVLQAQKMDVDEEIDRLEVHLAEVLKTLTRKEPIGRRLDFLMQELNREANTLGSKSQAIDTTNISVEMKVAIEQMREQIQNIE